MKSNTGSDIKRFSIRSSEPLSNVFDRQNYACDNKNNNRPPALRKWGSLSIGRISMKNQIMSNNVIIYTLEIQYVTMFRKHFMEILTTQANKYKFHSSNSKIKKIFVHMISIEFHFSMECSKPKIIEL